MANAIITLKIMPEAPDTDLEAIKEKANKILYSEVGEGDRKAEIEPIAFGLNALNLMFVMDEAKGSPDPIADKVKEIEGVQSAEVTDVRRAIG
ncbi:MAG: elongation factor 1-beta [Nanoarchaeota archaeon]|nr:elongation factor 1-beta [Nanoarchaeota archaeon]